MSSGWSYEQHWKFLQTSGPWWGALIAVLLVAALIIRRIQQFLKEGDAGPDDPLQRKLSVLEELQRGGGLAEEEIRSLKGRLKGQVDPLRKEIVSPSPSSAETASTDSVATGTPIATLPNQTETAS